MHIKEKTIEVNGRTEGSFLSGMLARKYREYKVIPNSAIY